MTVVQMDSRITLENCVFERPPGDDGEGPGFRLEVSDFHVRGGQRVALVGPSGSGKTTLLSMLSLALKPASIQRFVVSPSSGGEMDIAEAWRRMDDRLFDKLRSAFLGCARHSGESVAFIRAADALAARVALAGKRPDARMLARLLADVGLDGLGKRTPGRLSQGQRQRLGIACALAHKPDVVIADEPTASLDAANAERVMKLMANAADEGAAVVIATHDPELAVRHGFMIAAADMHEADGGRRRTSFSLLGAKG